MDPEHHGPFLAIINSLCPDIHAQAILIGVAPIMMKCKFALVTYLRSRCLQWAYRAVSHRTPNTFPCSRFFRSLESLRLRIWDSFVSENSIVNIPAHFAGISL